MKNIILFDLNNINHQVIKEISSFFDCEVRTIDFKNSPELKEIIVGHDRTALIGNNLWNTSSSLMRLKELIVVNIFCDADAIESPTFNAANAAILDLSELSCSRVTSLLKLWFNIPEYQPDGVHDQYIARLKEWGV